MTRTNQHDTLRGNKLPRKKPKRTLTPEEKQAQYGHRKAKATTAEQAEIIAFVCSLLAQRAYKHEIKKLLKAKYGFGSNRQCEVYISRAKQAMIRRTNRPREEHSSEAFFFYQRIIRSEDTSLNQKMWAQDKINALLGLNAAFKIEDATPEAHLAELNRLRREALANPQARAALALLTESLGGLAPSDNDDGSLAVEVIEGHIDLDAKTVEDITGVS